MNNKVLIPTILFVLALGFSFFVLIEEKKRDQIKPNKSEVNKSVPSSVPDKDQTENQIILFYGDGCPHCIIVEEYIKENEVDKKITFLKKEVYHNSNNSKELKEKARMCGLPTNSIGVPFLWDGEKCLIGDSDIVEFFKQKINAQ